MKLIKQITLALFLMLISPLVLADIYTDADQLFAYAEGEYRHFFSPVNQESLEFEPWYFRYYSETGNYVAVNTVDKQVYVLGENFPALVAVGLLEDFLSLSDVEDYSDGSCTILAPTWVAGCLESYGVPNTIADRYCTAVGGSWSEEACPLPADSICHELDGEALYSYHYYIDTVAINDLNALLASTGSPTRIDIGEMLAEMDAFCVADSNAPD